jgi:hypothetical protein
MDPPKAADHVATICVLQVYIAMDLVMNEYYTPGLEAYLTRFAIMCEQGAFEALQDVASYIEDGINSNWLKLWLRRKVVSRLRPPFFYFLVALRLFRINDPTDRFFFSNKNKNLCF